ncbi:MAG: thiamine-phosphate kinase [Proteobacteria bacterium]|nr:thiamine-phosphate kinase [Pseudomonadota bacterium]
MSKNEFDIIEKYFTFPVNRNDVVLAGGDDCAMVTVAEGELLLVTTDTLVSGIHFPEKTSPQDIAYKSVMVNLSDLAAMGARPAWLTLAITMPDIDEQWLASFSGELSSVLSQFNIALIGGDTTKGPLSITIQAMGLCDSDKTLRRDTARPGDKIFVTGSLGAAAVGLLVVQNGIEDKVLQPCVDDLNRPRARVEFGQALTEYSSCAIDVSDGLIADLGHILKASDRGAIIKLSEIPLSSATAYYYKHYNDQLIDWDMVLTRGDDYELCFTASADRVPEIYKLAEKHKLEVSCIGEISESNELVCLDGDGNTVDISATGFRHF